MKRLCHILAVAVVAFALPVAVSQSVHAAFVCDVGFTAPDSQNMCTSTETYQCSVTSNNSVTITNSSNQTVASGSVSTSGNTSGGSSSSGSVTNSDGTTFTVTITNPAPDEQQTGVCTATVRVPAREVPETVRPVGGSGAGAVAQAAVTPQPTALPMTSGDSSLSVMVGVAGVAASIAVIATGAALVYRRANEL